MVIELRHISKRYKSKFALHDFSTILRPGVYGLLGANGAGKTTLINILVGILAKSGGDILVDGKCGKECGKEFLRQVGYLPQYPQFYRDFTIQDFLEYMCALKEIPIKTGRERIRHYLDAVNLGNASRTKIGALSGGMRQRVGIVQALLGNPALLVLDEPTAGLDPQERIRFRNLISRFAAGRIVLLATHIVSDVDAIASQVILLKEGRLIRQNTPEALIHELDGKVWEVTLQSDADLAKYDALHISNMQRIDQLLRLRLIAENKPDENAQPVQANLDDVFLYHFSRVE